MKIVSNNHENTQKLGTVLAACLKVGDVIGLYGGLGAGKTAFVSGVANGLGYDDYISSPTFTIVNEYKTKIPIFHFDVYRVNDEDELWEIGFDEYFHRDGIVIIEWAEYIKNIMPKEFLKISISKKDEKPNIRQFELVAQGLRYEKLLQELRGKFGGVYEGSSS